MTVRNIKHTIVALPAIALLITGCGPPDTPQVAADPRSSPTPDPARTPEPTGPPTTIPADVRLPHEGAWAAKGNGADLSPLPGICVDPPTRLNDVDPTDGRAFYDDATKAAPSESLGVYADDTAAAEAVDDWREETALCGAAGPQSHTGEPVEWFVVKAAVDGADESWQAYELSEDVDGEDFSGHDPFVTVARVGNAVYVETSFHPGHLDDASIEASSSDGAGSVAAYLPMLEVFGA